MASVTRKGSSVGGKRIGGGGGGGQKPSIVQLPDAFYLRLILNTLYRFLGTMRTKDKIKRVSKARKKSPIYPNITQQQGHLHCNVYALVYRSMHHLMQ